MFFVFSDETVECSICMNDYVEGEVLSELPCGHLFHQACVNRWLPIKETCPLCRHDITQQADAPPGGGGAGTLNVHEEEVSVAGIGGAAGAINVHAYMVSVVGIGGGAGAFNVHQEEVSVVGIGGGGAAPFSLGGMPGAAPGAGAAASMGGGGGFSVGTTNTRKIYRGRRRATRR